MTAILKSLSNIIEVSRYIVCWKFSTSIRIIGKTYKENLLKYNFRSYDNEVGLGKVLSVNTHLIKHLWPNVLKNKVIVVLPLVPMRRK